METIRDCTPEEIAEIHARMQGGFLQHGDGEPDEARAFDCVKCGKHYVPRKTQWIFYDLCDECFIPFDREKMAQRVRMISDEARAALELP